MGLIKRHRFHSSFDIKKALNNSDLTPIFTLTREIVEKYWWLANMPIFPYYPTKNK